MANQIINSDPGHTRLKEQLHKNVKINFASPSKSTDVKEKEKKKSNCEAFCVARKRKKKKAKDNCKAICVTPKHN